MDVLLRRSKACRCKQKSTVENFHVCQIDKGWPSIVARVGKALARGRLCHSYTMPLEQRITQTKGPIHAHILGYMNANLL